MNKTVFKIFIISLLVLGSRNIFYSQNPAACANTQNLCTNSLFSFSASAGTGLTPGLTVSNPFGNPQAVNAGCMFTNVANPQWLMINITSSGNLGFSFGAFGSAFPQAGNYDWIMWPYSPTACNDIFANTLPPVACNWNCTGSGGTGMGTVPFGASPCNFQPSIPVVQGQQFIVLITNPSGVNTPVSFANTGTAGMSCNPLLYPNLTACPGQLAVFTGTWVNATSGTYTLYPGAIVQTSPSFTVSSLVNQVYTVQAQGLNTSAVPIADQTTFTLTINPIIPISITTPTNYCYGSNATFTLNPAGSGTFNVTGPSAPTTSFATTSIAYPNVTTPNIGTFTVAASYTNGCTGTQTTQVNVAPNHSITVSSNTNVCMNGTVNLTSSMPTATAYAWTGPGAYSSSVQNPIINTIQPSASGNYTVSSNINFNGITCPKTNTVQVSVVTTSAVAVTPNFTLCQGSNLNLVSNAVGAVSYSWNGPGAFASSAQNTVVAAVSPTNAGNYTATAYFTNGSLTCTTSAVSSVSVVATSPVILTIPSHTCQNSNIIMGMGAIGATAFNWSGPNAFNATNATTNIVNVQPVASGVYTATATFAIGTFTCSTTNTASMSVVTTNTVAVTPNFTVCQGSNVNLTSSASPAFSYSWTGPGTYTSGVQNPTVTSVLPSSAGNYTAVALFTDGVLTCTTNAVANVSVVATSPVTLTVPTHTCQNSNINLTMAATGATGFNWAGPNAFTSTSASTNIVNVQPVASGIYTATTTFSIGAVTCSTSNTASMSVVTTNTVAVTPNFTVCQGSNVNLTSSAAPAFSYSWAGPGTYTSGVQNPTVTSVLPSSAGNYTATAYFTDGVLTCTTNAAANVSVVATSPVTLTVPTHTCQNSNINLTMAATGATGFNWAGPNAFTSTSASTNIVNVQPVASGIYTATTTFSIGAVTCSTSNTASMSVVTTNTVAVTPNFTVCQGSNVNLTSSAAPAFSYSWTGPGSYTSGVQNPTVTSVLPSSAGNYTAVALFTDGVLTCTTNAVANVSVVATPTTAITYPANICQNATANFTAAAVGAVSYTWAGPNSFSATGATTSIPNIQTNGSGIYTTTTLFTMGTVSCTTNTTNSLSVVGTNTVAVSPDFTVCSGFNVPLTSNATSAVSYSWSGPGSYTSGLQNPTINSILTSGTGIYTATALFSNGSFTCTTSATLNGSVIAIPPLNVTAASSVICNLQSSTITASGSLNYTWTPAGTLNTPNGATVVANPSVTTVYSITGQDASGCYKTNTISLVVNPLPTLATTSNTMCFGTNALLSVNGGVSYTWAPAGTLSSANGATVTASPPTNTTYTVTGESNKGCLNTATASVLVKPLPILSISDHTICYGNSTTISVAGATSYTWAPPTALSATTSPNVIANPLTTTTYTVIGQDLNGCKQSTISTVVVNSLPVISIISPSVICAGQSALMNANGATTYTWSNNVFTPSQSVNPVVPTTYSVTGKDANGCVNTETVFLNVLIQPTLTIIGTPTVCLGNLLTLTATGGLDYTWNTGETTNVIAVSPQANNTYTVSSGISPCNSSTIFAVTVYTPQSQTPYADPPIIIYGSSSVIHANVSSGNPFSWSASSDITCANCETNTITPTGTTVYSVTLTDNQGCIITNTVLVQVDIICGDVFIPSAFSPNNDGFNDFWCVYSNCLTSMNIQLYNRWGEKVFESGDKNNCWDGTFNGVMQNDAVFIYQLKASLVNGEEVIKKGNVTLKR
ncbi:MAG: gliding motility-associated C-terminal domain-containing protein [Bacteroidia bacterium]|nr:gliding motility-associated C-terminal domain-containing protein [Bacteroidia bacterium]